MRMESYEDIINTLALINRMMDNMKYDEIPVKMYSQVGLYEQAHSFFAKMGSFVKYYFPYYGTQEWLDHEDDEQFRECVEKMIETVERFDRYCEKAERILSEIRRTKKAHKEAIHDAIRRIQEKVPVTPIKND